MADNIISKIKVGSVEYELQDQDSNARIETLTAKIAGLETTLATKQNRILTWGDLLEDPEVINVSEEGA